MLAEPLKLNIRRARPSDRAAVMSILAATNSFRPNELLTAREVFDDAIAKGPKGDYQSFVAEEKRNTARRASHAAQQVGWLCFGPTPCTLGTFDIYWVVVHPRNQKCGIGSFLIQYAENLIRRRSGRMIVVDTSGSPRYLSARRLYRSNGYRRAAGLKNFYAPGDDKIIFVKRL
jgi:ribosomal protein S18 acetylase RimI-like enzyme